MSGSGQLMIQTVGEVEANTIVNLYEPLEKEDFDYNKGENQEFPETLKRVNGCVQNLINRVIKEVAPSKTFEILLFMANIAVLPAVYNATSLKLFMTYLTLSSVPTFLFLFRIYSALQNHGVFGALAGGVRKEANNFCIAVLKLPDPKKSEEEIGLERQIRPDQISSRNVLHNHNEERRLPAEKMYAIRRRWFIGAVGLTLAWVVAPRIPIVGRVVNWFMNGGIAWDLMVKGISVASIIYGLVWSYLKIYNNAKPRGASVNVIVDGTTEPSKVSTDNLVSIPEEKEEEEVEGEEEEEIELDEDEQKRRSDVLEKQVKDLTQENEEFRAKNTVEMKKFGQNLNEMHVCFEKMCEEDVEKNNALAGKVRKLTEENDHLKKRESLNQKEIGALKERIKKISETLRNERKELEKYYLKEKKRKELERNLKELDNDDADEEN